MNISKYAFALVLVTATTIGLSGIRPSDASVRKSSQFVSNQTLEEKMGAITDSTVASSLRLTSPSSVSQKAAFTPVPHPAPSGTGGAGSR